MTVSVEQAFQSPSTPVKETAWLVVFTGDHDQLPDDELDLLRLLSRFEQVTRQNKEMK
jgi:hypothetical protein